MMDDVRCKGTEKRLSDCRYRGWNKANCDHYEDVGVKCHAPKLQGHKVGSLTLTRRLGVPMRETHIPLGRT